MRETSIIPPFSPATIWSPGQGPLVLTCEHASNRLPPHMAWPRADRWIIGTHWAWDIGIAEVTMLLAERLSVTAALAGFSRLVVDPNRAPEDATFIRTNAHGRIIHLNEAISPEDHGRRVALWQAWHDQVDAVTRAQPGRLILSMHSFTPHYEEDEPRSMEIGVLFDRDEAEAHALADALANEGLRVALNEPYSGKGNLMYCVERHAVPDGRVALELEVRQDLADDPFVRRRLVPAIERAVRAVASLF